MPAKHKKTKAKAKGGRKIELPDSSDAAFWEEVGRPGTDVRLRQAPKRMICLRLDPDVLEWFQAQGPGYQTRINRILQRVMEEGKKRKT